MGTRKDKSNPKHCFWKWDSDGFYETECKQMFCFEVEGIKENHYNFCPYCGKKIKVNPIDKEGGE